MRNPSTSRAGGGRGGDSLRAGARRLDRGRLAAVGRRRPRLHVRTRRAWHRAGRPAGRSGCGRARSAKGIRRSSSRAGGSTRCTGRPGRRGGRRSRKRSSPRSTRRPARRSGSHSTRSPTAGIDFTQGAGPHCDAAHRRQPPVRDELAQRAVRARQGDRQARSGRTTSSRSSARRRPAAATACSPLLYNGTIIVTDGRARTRRSAAFNQQTGALVWKAGDFDVVAGVADADRRRRAAAAGRLRRRPRRRHGSRERPRAVEASAQDRLGAEHQHAGLVAGRSPAVRVVGVRHRQPRARAAPGRRQDHGDREVAQQPRCASTSARSSASAITPTRRAATSVRRSSPRST